MAPLDPLGAACSLAAVCNNSDLESDLIALPIPELNVLLVPLSWLASGL